MTALSYPEAVGVGLLQGVTELFPVSSLGHSILVPALVGGRLARDLNVAATDSPYLNVLVGLHLATALALVVYFWRDWVRVIGGLWTSIRDRKVETVDQKLAWMLVIATIPVGIAGVALDHVFREHLGKPVPAACFLAANGLVLYLTERLRRGGGGRHRVGAEEAPGAELTQRQRDEASDARITRLSYGRATLIGAAQILALLPGISRSGVTISAGIFRGLNHEDSARFAFLLATPVIAAAALLKLPPLMGHQGDGIRGPLLAGSVAAFVAAYIAVRWLTRYFETRTLTPFAIYCLVAGAGSAVYLSVR
ncbi:undecaprenyl-diphosphatase [Mangrovactinospora gilvigrisea]|uniref:Undecaprenyl-diphosphatase n=1 Tax=Mangrovactinospora gilvigrisea TaxID=1428644 RepID=A0A1J7C131_9ACTN|nr:undecaprenyl-diphosphate phosphatase [Mangrovactinospora gilvigrisea]OIV35276.1 undecaprenyl-diphosphatase [Mangrovactinospora gilvigrisea]